MAAVPGQGEGVEDTPAAPLEPDPAPGAREPSELRDNLVAEARTHLHDLLAACEIAQVIHVDDLNPAGAATSIDVEYIIGAITSGRLKVDLLRQMEVLAGLLSGVSDEEESNDILARLRSEPPDMSSEELSALMDAAHAVLDAPAPATDSNPTPVVGTDLDVMTDLREIIDVDYVPITLGAWEAGKVSYLSDSRPTLIVFDRDFTREKAGATHGDLLLAEALKAGNSNLRFGLLTHSAGTAASEQRVAEEIQSSYSIDPLDVVVISKSSIHEDPREFPKKLKASLLADPLKALRNAVEEGHRLASVAATQTIAQLQPHTLHGLVTAAETEGTHGADNLLRVAATATRHEVLPQVRLNPTVTASLGRIRAIDQLKPDGSNLPVAEVSALLRRDRIDDAEFLSRLHLPLEAGDVFETTAVPESEFSGAQYLVLVGQPCDLAMRERGRLADPRTLNVARIAAVETPHLHDHRLEWFADAPSGRTWVVQSFVRFAVPTVALDACVFTEDGTSRIVPSQPVNECLTPGWQARQAVIQKWASNQIARFRGWCASRLVKNDEDVRHNLAQALTTTADWTSPFSSFIDLGDANESPPREPSVTFGIKRIGHITEDETRAIITVSGHYVARPAQAGPLFTES